jgi:hypothetical protein
LTGSAREKEIVFERRADAGRLEEETAIMGMDVLGKAPTAPEGEYFRRNTLNWGPLVDCVTTLCPDETAPCKGWNYNSGDGLNADGAAALATKLEVLLGDGDVAAYCADYDAWADQGFQAGKGFGPAECMNKAAMDRIAAIHAAAKLGEVMPARRFSPSDVDEFIAFLKASGGFEIW